MSLFFVTAISELFHCQLLKSQRHGGHQETFCEKLVKNFMIFQENARDNLTKAENFTIKGLHYRSFPDTFTYLSRIAKDLLLTNLSLTSTSGETEQKKSEE